MCGSTCFIKESWKASSSCLDGTSLELVVLIVHPWNTAHTVPEEKKLGEILSKCFCPKIFMMIQTNLFKKIELRPLCFLCTSYFLRTFHTDLTLIVKNIHLKIQQLERIDVLLPASK